MDTEATVTQLAEDKLDLLPPFSEGCDLIRKNETNGKESKIGYYLVEIPIQYPAFRIPEPIPSETDLKPPFEDKQETENTKTKKISEKIMRLYDNLGKELFSKLSYDQMILMVNTFGVVDLGLNVDIKRIYRSIKG